MDHWIGGGPHRPATGSTGSYATATAVRDRRPGAGPPYEQRHRGDQRGGGDRRPERGSRCQQHSSGTAVQGAHRRHAEAAGPHLPLRRHRVRDQPRRTDRLGRPRRWRRLLRPSPLRPRVPGVHWAHADPVPRSPAAVPARTSRPRAGQLAAAGRLISYKSESSRNANFGAPKAEEHPVGKVVMYASVSVDGFIADENDQPGPLFDWLLSGDVPLDESGVLKVSQTSYDYTRPYWDQIGVTIAGRHVFDMTDGWDGKPPSGIEHVVVVTHRPEPEGWDPEAPFHFVDGIEAAMAKAQELAGDRIVEVAAGDVGGQMLAAGLIDEVRMDVVPVVFGSGKRYFGSVHAQHLLADPDVVIHGNRVLHLRFPVRR